MWLHYRTYEKLFQSIIYNFGHLHLSCVYRQSNILRVYSCFIYIFQVCCKQFSVTKAIVLPTKCKSKITKNIGMKYFVPNVWNQMEKFKIPIYHQQLIEQMVSNVLLSEETSLPYWLYFCFFLSTHEIRYF